MKNLIILSLLLLSTVFADWPFYSVTDADGNQLSEYESSDAWNEYPDSDASDTLGICWKPSYARYGYPLTGSCSKGLIQIGVYCYHPCQEGYTEGYFSGLYSETDQDPNVFESTSDVESFCWENCPEGYQYDGASTCWKGREKVEMKHYNRTYVQELVCSSGLELDGQLCYAPAQEGYTCNGPLCYGKCPKGWGICGALCARFGNCKDQVMYEGFDVDESLNDMASALKDPSAGKSVNATAVPGVLNGTQYPFCH